MSGDADLAAGIIGDLAAAIIDTSRALDSSYPASLCGEAIDRRRIDKLAEEVGEVIDAYNGYVGENPRKGVTNDLAKVLEELIDVAACALGAYEHLTDCRGESIDALCGQTIWKRDRLAAAIAGAS